MMLGPSEKRAQVSSVQQAQWKAISGGGAWSNATRHAMFCAERVAALGCGLTEGSRAAAAPEASSVRSAVNDGATAKSLLPDRGADHDRLASSLSQSSVESRWRCKTRAWGRSESERERPGRLSLAEGQFAQGWAGLPVHHGEGNASETRSSPTRRRAASVRRSASRNLCLSCENSFLE